MALVYKSLNKPLTILGVERRLFFSALVASAATFTSFNSPLSALLMFGVLFTLARKATKQDAQILRILLNSSRFRTRYDAAKRTPVEVIVQ